MVHQCAYNKKKRKKDAGLSLIEVLIVMAITGFTLIALLNLAVRDLQIEKLNEEQDIANYISVSQIEEFDDMKSKNSACLTTLSSSLSKDYYICNQNGIGTLISACDTPTWHLYQQPTNSSYTYVSYQNGSYDCTQSAPSTGVYYQERLYINSFDNTNRVADIESDVLFNSLQNVTYPVTLRELYYY